VSAVKVWLALVALTLVEVALAWVHTAPALMLGLLVALSLGKAGLIAWYFMHLREWRPRPLVLLFPVLAVCVVLLLALLPEGLRAGTMR
jgi:caa(3)-type oxidase subunit IV